MSFSVNDGYKMAVTIGPREDFLTDDKFISFIVIENIGLSLPYWELKFDCVFPDLLRFFNEKQPITVQFGTSTEDLEPITLVIKKPIVIPKSTDCHTVTLRGFTSMHAYLELEKFAVYTEEKPISSLELFKAKAKDYGLVFKSNLDKTNDEMTYMQPGTTDYKFLFTEWLHSYYQDNDIIIPAITTKGELTYNSLSKLIADSDLEKLVTFTDTKPEKNEILVNANTGTESNTTLTNMLGGYVKTREIYDIDNGIITTIDASNVTPIISESKTTSIDESISKSSGFYVQSSNVHKNYYKQELLNTQKWLSIQSSKQWVSTPNRIIKNVYPGDLAVYMSKKDNGQINDQISGLYLVVKKVISIKNRSTSTNFLLSRENMNYSK